MTAILSAYKDWLKIMEPAFHAFEKAKNNPSFTQESILKNYLQSNQNTLYGRLYNFSAIENYKQYRKNVPIIEDFSQLDTFIDKISKGEKNVLTSEDVLFFETTSGTSGMKKQIPYTNKLLQEFRYSIAVWMHHLYQQYPHSFSGKAFWSISPPLKNKDNIKSTIPIGMESDLDYFDQKSKGLLLQVLLHTANDSSTAYDFYFQLAIQLLLEENLAFVSIWSPNYLLQLDDFIRQNFTQLMDVISSNQKRFEFLKNKEEQTWDQWFPNLSLVSCWQDAQSAMWLDQVKNKLGNIRLHRKGLLSTECVISTPISDNQSALACTSHFFEFINERNNEITSMENIEKGGEYEIVVTTGGGLYRYRTHDVISVADFYGEIPIVHFEGRNNQTSDLVGEKISARVIRPFLQRVKTEYQSIQSMALMPIKLNNSIRYLLLLESNTMKTLGNLEDKLEEFLLKNPYYQQSRSSGQLKKVKCISIENLNEKIIKAFKNQKQIRDGDIKIPEILPLNFIDIST